jgi:hypothetical protein
VPRQAPDRRAVPASLQTAKLATLARPAYIGPDGDR